MALNCRGHESNFHLWMAIGETATLQQTSGQVVHYLPVFLYLVYSHHRISTQLPKWIAKEDVAHYLLKQNGTPYVLNYFSYSPPASNVATLASKCLIHAHYLSVHLYGHTTASSSPHFRTFPSSLSRSIYNHNWCNFKIPKECSYPPVYSTLHLQCSSKVDLPVSVAYTLWRKL